MSCPQPWIRSITVQSTWNGQLEKPVDLKVYFEVDSLPGSELRLLNGADPAVRAASIASIHSIPTPLPRTLVRSGTSFPPSPRRRLFPPSPPARDVFFGTDHTVDAGAVREAFPGPLDAEKNISLGEGSQGHTKLRSPGGESESRRSPRIASTPSFPSSADVVDSCFPSSPAKVSYHIDPTQTISPTVSSTYQSVTTTNGDLIFSSSPTRKPQKLKSRTPSLATRPPWRSPALEDTDAGSRNGCISLSEPRSAGWSTSTNVESPHPHRANNLFPFTDRKRSPGALRYSIGTTMKENQCDDLFGTSAGSKSCGASPEAQFKPKCIDSDDRDDSLKVTVTPSATGLVTDQVRDEMSDNSCGCARTFSPLSEHGTEYTARDEVFKDGEDNISGPRLTTNSEGDGVDLPPSPSPSSQLAIPWTTSQIVGHDEYRKLNNVDTTLCAHVMPQPSNVDGVLVVDFPPSNMQGTFKVEVEAQVLMVKGTRGGWVLSIPGLPQQTEGGKGTIVLAFLGVEESSNQEFRYVTKDCDIEPFEEGRLVESFSLDRGLQLTFVHHEEVHVIDHKHLAIEYVVDALEERSPSPEGEAIRASFTASCTVRFLNSPVLWSDYVTFTMFVFNGPSGAHDISIGSVNRRLYLESGDGEAGPAKVTVKCRVDEMEELIYMSWTAKLGPFPLSRRLPYISFREAPVHLAPTLTPGTNDDARALVPCLGPRRTPTPPPASSNSKVKRYRRKTRISKQHEKLKDELDSSSLFKRGLTQFSRCAIQPFRYWGAGCKLLVYYLAFRGVFPETARRTEMSVLSDTARFVNMQLIQKGRVFSELAEKPTALGSLGWTLDELVMEAVRTGVTRYAGQPEEAQRREEKGDADLGKMRPPDFEDRGESAAAGSDSHWLRDFIDYRLGWQGPT